MKRMGYRESQYRWNDLLMWGEDSQNWLTERARFQSVASSGEKPEVYTVTITKTGDSTANNTVVIGGVTFTAKASPNTEAGNEYTLTATAGEIATLVANKGLANYTVKAKDGVITYTQTTPGTGSAVTVGAGTDTTVSATVEKTQNYAEAITGVEYELMAGEPVGVVSTDFDGVKTVQPISAASGSETYSDFVGFVMEPISVKNGEKVEVAICCGRCRLNLDNMIKFDANGNAYDWSYGPTTLRGYAEAKGFKFGKNVSGLEYTK